MTYFRACARVFLFAMLCIAINVSPQSANGQELPTIRVVGPSFDGIKPVYYGVRAGLFRKYGLNVVVSPISNGAAALAAVAGGSADVAWASLVPVFQAHLRGIPFQIVAPSAFYLTGQASTGMVVGANSKARTGRDLNGKTIGAQSLSDLNGIASLAWIDKTGGDSSTVHIVEIPSSAVADALGQNRIEAATLVSPFLQQAIASGKARMFGASYDAIASRFETSGYVTTADFVAKNHDAMIRFAQALHEAIVYTNSHLPETVDLVASYSGVDASDIAHAVRVTDPEYLEAQNIQPLIDVSAKYHVIDHTFKAEDLISPIASRSPRTSP